MIMRKAANYNFIGTSVKIRQSPGPAIIDSTGMKWLHVQLCLIINKENRHPRLQARHGSGNYF